MQPSASAAPHVHELFETMIVGPCSDCGEMLWRGGLACIVDGCGYVTCECRWKGKKDVHPDVGSGLRADVSRMRGVLTMSFRDAELEKK